MRRTRASRSSAIGGQPATAVDEDRHGALDGEREDGLQPLVAQREGLRARVQLDAARPAVEAALGFLERLRGEVEADEGDELPLGALRVRERAVVRHGERGLAVRLVEAEHERAAEPVAVERPRELVVVPDHPVDVVAEVRVDVEEVCALGELAAELLVPRLDHRPRPLERRHDRRAFQTRGGVIGSS